MGRRNLVVVRAGARSLHHGWLAGGHSRNWDLIVSYYDPVAFAERGTTDADVLEFLHPGGKWEGLSRLFGERDLLRQYDYFLFPDDDIEVTPPSIDVIFQLAHEHQFAVCQPALSHDSYLSFLILAACTGFHLRYVNFVEIMVPCLRRDTLAALLPFFRNTRSGFGLDFVWHRLGESNFGKGAVLDCVRVRHTRPVSSGVERIQNLGVSPKEEMRVLTSAFGVAPTHRPLAYGGVTSSGKVVYGKVRVGIWMTASYIRELRSFVNVERPLPKILKVLLRQTTKKVELSPLRPDYSGTSS